MPATTAIDVSADGRKPMVEIQRARLLAAMVEIAAERGLAEATVARVVTRAGVSRRTFYDLYEDREQCFLAALEAAVERAAGWVVPAYRSGGGWLERLRLGLAALLGFLDAERAAGRLLIAGSVGAGPRALARREQVYERLVAAVEEGRAETGADPPPLSAEGAVGGALSIVQARLLAGAYPLGALHGQLMGILAMPYLGAAAARRELARPAPEPPSVAPRAAGGEALRDLGTRLTYRTVRVLAHLAEHPGCSNRAAGLAVGVADQGQISKLLSRLQRLGLIENVGGPAGRGAPNAWRLTGRGRAVREAMGAGV